MDDRYAGSAGYSIEGSQSSAQHGLGHDGGDFAAVYSLHYIFCKPDDEPDSQPCQSHELGEEGDAHEGA
ncbi:hypothetical protein D3C78_1068190 [compost metagenome]